MNNVAFVTDPDSFAIDFDMDLLVDACKPYGIHTTIANWTDMSIDWQRFDAVVIRSPWSYTDNLAAFVEWCKDVAAKTHLFNPVDVVRWGLDKSYMGDLAAQGVPIVPTTYVSPGQDCRSAIAGFLHKHSACDAIVIKPTVGAYSRDVGRYSKSEVDSAVQHAQDLFSRGFSVIVQPYLPSIDAQGETDMIYFDGVYSHAIRKEPLLLADGTVNVPSTEARSPRVASNAEKVVAEKALAVIQERFKLEKPLLYARIDLIRDFKDTPVVLELEISEPSLSLPFAPQGAERFAAAIAGRLADAKANASPVRSA